MAEHIFVRRIHEDLWQWRTLAEDNQWRDEIHNGDKQALEASLKDKASSVCLVVPGQSAVVRNVPVDGVEKKHLAKLLPYEMEDQLIDSVEDLHFCFGKVVDDQVNLIYLETESIQSTLDYVLSLGVDVAAIYPDYFLLDQGDADGVLLLEGEVIQARFNEGSGFAIEINVAPLVLEDLKVRFAEGDVRLRLVAETAEGLSVLKSCLPEEWQDDERIQVEEFIENYLDAIDPGLESELNLRSGAFSRQLPFARWWGMWQTPAIVAAVAFVVAVIVTFVDYKVAQSEGKAIRSEMEAVYLQAVPKGRKGDEEKRLRNLLKGKGKKTGQPTNLVFLLGGLSETLAKQKDIQLSNFRYNGEQLELQVNIEVKGLNELSKFREMLASSGLESGSPRTSRQGEVYQASMKITEKK